MHFKFWPALAAVSILTISVVVPAENPVKVEVRKTADGWKLVRDGKPYYIYGAGGSGNLELLKSLGGTSIRTWSADPRETGRVFPETHRLGLMIAAGLWLEPERHGFDYNDASQVKRQFEQSIAAVQRLKNEPNVLVWGVGNEMEGDGTKPEIWRAVNEIAREIHRIDPNHPTMTVIAGTGKNAIKLTQFMKYCPDVDILGINSYGGMAILIDEVRAAKLDRPFIVTEFGPLGWWERPRTSWGAPLEQTSTEKAETYQHSYEHSVSGAGDLCLGSYAFVWGAKQERTHTWFGLLVPAADGKMEKTAVVDVLSYEWTGHWPGNRAPRITPIRTDADQKEVAPSETFAASVEAVDPDGDRLTYDWQVREETHDAKEGGDAEAAPPAHPEAMLSNGVAQVKFQAPNTPGAYRLYVAIHDGHGSVATANVPFFVKPK